MKGGRVEIVENVKEKYNHLLEEGCKKTNIYWDYL